MKITIPRACLGLAILMVAAGATACTVSAEAEVPDVEVTQHDITFTGIPLAGRLGDVATELTFTQDKPTLGLPIDLDTSAKAVRVDLIAKHGIANFDFLRVLRVTMAPSAGATETTAPVELFNYEKSDTAPTTSTLSIPSKNPVNMLDQWKTDSALFTVQLEGTLPEQDWSIDLGVHFSGKLSYKF